MKLPEGTLFCKGKPWGFENLHVKGETLTNDFYARSLQWVSANDSGEAMDRLEEMKEHGASYPIEDAEGRDGCFDNEDLFLVYEASDLADLKDVVTKAFVIATLPQE